MPDPPTPIIHPAATRSEPFQRTNGVPAQANGGGPPPRKPKLKKLRLALVISGLSVLALISTVFGMLMAVASDLPSLESRAQYDRAENSVLYADDFGCQDLENDRRVPADREADRQPEPHPRGRGRDLAEREERGDRDRGPPLLRPQGRGLHGHRPRARPGRPQAARRPGWLHDHPAVREERAGRPGRPVRVPEAPRVRARLPPRAPVAEGEDPHPVPQHRVLRERRLRHRVRGAHLLRRRRRARGAGRRRRRRRELHAAGGRRGAGPGRPRGRGRGAAGGRPARGHDRLAEHVRPDRAPQGGDGAAQPGAPADAGPEGDHADAVRRGDRGRACPPRTTWTRRTRSRSSPTSRPG